MKLLGPARLAAGDETTLSFPAGSSPVGVEVENISGFLLAVTVSGRTHWLTPWTAEYYPVGFTDNNVTMIAQTDISPSSGDPEKVIGTLFESNDPTPTVTSRSLSSLAIISAVAGTVSLTAGTAVGVSGNVGATDPSGASLIPPTATNIGSGVAGAYWPTSSGSLPDGVHSRMPWESGEQQCSLLLRLTSFAGTGAFQTNWSSVVLGGSQVATNGPWAVPAGQVIRVTSAALTCFEGGTSGAAYGTVGIQDANTGAQAVTIPFYFTTGGKENGSWGVGNINQEMAGQIYPLVQIDGQSGGPLYASVCFNGFVYTP